MSVSATVYSGLATLSAPFLRRMLSWRGVQGKEIPARLGERFGVSDLARPEGRLIWLHAASVGETLSLLPVIEALEGQAEVLLTTGTVTSAELAAARLPAFARHQFTPLDVPGWVKKFLDHWQPDCAVFVESELWPNVLTALDARGIPRLLINGSMSARSARRWRRGRGLARNMLAGFRAVHAQSARDAENLAALGAESVLQWGNLKFAAPLLPVDELELKQMRQAIATPSWLAASTHEGEEEIVIAAHRILSARFPALVTLIAPRHPVRGAAVAALAAGLPVALRSQSEPPPPGGIYVADTLGELGLFYRISQIALVGGSLVEIGGHNIIEPARLGVAVLTGPHTQEITEQVEILQAAAAIVEVTDAETLAAALQDWLDDPVAALEIGAKGLRAFDGLETLPGRLATLILEHSL
jgi:3-deoxy-D-manno-octulosonic-acid transferase